MPQCKFSSFFLDEMTVENSNVVKTQINLIVVINLLNRTRLIRPDTESAEPKRLREGF